MYGIAITYGVVSLLLLGGFAYITFKMTSKKKIFYLSEKERQDLETQQMWNVTC